MILKKGIGTSKVPLRHFAVSRAIRWKHIEVASFRHTSNAARSGRRLHLDELPYASDLKLQGHCRGVNDPMTAVSVSTITRD
jgi:hypothetical protein